MYKVVAVHRDIQYHGMPQISNIGGSLTSAVVLTFLAWGVRLLRATAQRQGPSRKGSSSENGGPRPRFFAALTPAALRRLVSPHRACCGVMAAPHPTASCCSDAIKGCTNLAAACT